MTTMQVAWNPTTRVAKVQTNGDAVGAGFSDIGSFDHHDDADDELGIEDNHVYFHHVRDLLYAEGVENMQNVSINVLRCAGISCVIGDDTLANEATSQITTTFDPALTTDRRLTYSSSDEDVATVSATGLVTADAANDGEAVITITSVDGGFQDTITVTVA